MKKRVVLACLLYNRARPTKEPINSELSQASKGLDPHGPASMDSGGQENTPLR